MAAHLVRLHVPPPDGVQHEETHVQDALQGGRPGRKRANQQWEPNVGQKFH